MYTQRIEEHGFQLVERVDDTSRTVVWKAVQTTLERTVIIRVLKPRAAENPEEVRHFLTVARLLSRIKSESLAAVFDVVSEGDLHYIVMEHVEGPTLEELVRSQGPQPVDQALRIASSLCTCLEQMWLAERIVHRNLKPSTIRLDSRGVAKITDFSLAIVAGPGVDATARDGGHIVGTPCFLSPEQAQGSHLLTTQSDMYALGALLYHLATGHVPFEERDVVEILACHIKHQVPPPHLRAKHIPLAFSWFLHRLMMKNPSNRYADWGCVLQDIRLLLAGDTPTCVRPGEEYLSTIEDRFDDPEPEPPAAAGESGEGPRLRFVRKSPSSKMAAYQGKHIVDGHADEIRKEDQLRAAVCWSLLAGWLALVFWFRAVYQTDESFADAAKSLSRLTNTVTQRMSDSLDELKTLSDKLAAEPAAAETASSAPPAADVPPAAGPARIPEDAPAPATAAAAPPSAAAAAVPDSAAAAGAPAQPHAPPAAAEPPPAGIPPDLRQSLARAFASGDLAAARQAADAYAGDFLEKADLRKLLAAAPDPDELVAAYLKTQVGRPLIFEHNGKQRTVIPRGVDGGVIHLEANGRGVDVAISQLTPEGKLRWMDKPADPAQSLAYCLALLRSNRRDEVAARTAGCPLLSGALAHAAELAPAAATPPAQ